MEIDKERYLKKENKKTSERAELLKVFVEEINKYRAREGKKEFRVQYISLRIAHIPTEDLYFFLKKCQSGHFNKIFFGSLRVR